MYECELLTFRPVSFRKRDISCWMFSVRVSVFSACEFCSVSWVHVKFCVLILYAVPFSSSPREENALYAAGCINYYATHARNPNCNISKQTVFRVQRFACETKDTGETRFALGSGDKTTTKLHMHNIPPVSTSRPFHPFHPQFDTYSKYTTSKT